MSLTGRNYNSQQRKEHEINKEKAKRWAANGAMWDTREKEKRKKAIEQQPLMKEWRAYRDLRDRLVRTEVAKAIKQHPGNEDEILNSAFTNARNELNNRHPVVWNDPKLNRDVDGRPALDRQLEDIIRSEINEQLRESKDKGGEGR